MPRASLLKPFMLPWAEMMKAAAAIGIAPQAFWQLSLREWLWLSQSGARGMHRDELDALLQEYPDGRV